MMFDYDLIIVSKTTEDLKSMVQETIDTCLENSGGKSVNIILVETSGNKPDLERVNTVVMYEGEFNYNRALNEGLKHRKGKCQMLANNDLVFGANWGLTHPIMEANSILSASVLSANNQYLSEQPICAYEGYRIAFFLTGWLIFTDSKLWDIIGKLPENHNFWYSDNDYADTLIEHGIMHYLLNHATVIHIGSQTLQKQPQNVINQYTKAEGVKYEQKRNQRNIL